MSITVPGKSCQLSLFTSAAATAAPAPAPAARMDLSEHVSLSRSRSISYAHGRGRRRQQAREQDSLAVAGDVAAHAPLHSTVSAESIASRASSRGDLFQPLSADAIPGNIHMSSSQSIEHLIRRYGAVTLIRQLSTDLARREAELSLLQKRYSSKENVLVRLLQEMGFSTSQVDSLLKERMDSLQADDSYLQGMISDAMEDGILHSDAHSKASSDGFSPTSSQQTRTHRNSSSSSVDEANVTITPKRMARPHSLSSPPAPLQREAPNSILNTVSSRLLNHVPQPVQDAITNTTTLTTTPTHRLVPVEMENFNSTLFTDPPPSSNFTHRDYVDQFGFLYDNKQNRSSHALIASTAAATATTTTTSASSMPSAATTLTTKLLSIANDYDKSQQQTNKEWDEFIKKVTLMDNHETNGDWFLINGKNIRHYKPLHKNFIKLVQNGVPMKYRPKVWSELSGSKHLMNPGEYQLLLNGNQENKEAEAQIELDLYRTMPFNVFFKDNGPGLEKLQNVLIAFARKYTTIGYCQGMNFIVANLLLVFQSEEDAFWAFIGLIENVLPNGFFNLSNIKNDLNQLKSNFKEHLPKLFDHLTTNDVELEPICFNWFMSLFTDSLSAQIVFRIWDNLMLNGYVEMQKTSIALFKVFEERLMTMHDNVEIYEFMKNLNKTNFNLKGSELIRISSGIKIEE